MFTSTELETLKTICQQNPEAMAILERVVARLPACNCCDHFQCGHFCKKWNDDVPEEHRRDGCDAWEPDFIPF